MHELMQSLHARMQVTPMATQLTYEGLLDEVFGLSCGQARMEAEGALAHSLARQITTVCKCHSCALCAPCTWKAPRGRVLLI